MSGSPLETPPPKPSPQETLRLAALERYRILDTAREAEFDDIVTIAAQLCDVPMALISLVDDRRQWFKAAVGLEATETPREIAFCAHAIQQDDVFVVEDARLDARFAGNPLVTGDPHLRFYAGAPLETPDGFKLGTICVLDREPRAFSEQQHAALQALARQVMAQLELRHTLIRLRAEEEQRRLILESAVDYAIISLDLNGLIVSWNEGARRILGWAEHEIKGLRCNVFFTPEDNAAGVPDREMGAALTRGSGTDERWHLRRDGVRFWASGEMMPLTNDEDQPVGFLKIMRDRTAQRLSEERRAALLELGDQLRDVEDPAAMAFAAARIMGEALHVDYAGHGLISEDSESIVIEGDWTNAGVQSVAGEHRFEDYARVAEQLRRGEVVVVEDVARHAIDEREQERLHANRIGAFVNLPLFEWGRLVAVFFVATVEPREWSIDEIGFLRAVAERTRLAVERRQAEIDLRDLAASLETQVDTRVRERNRLWSSTSDLMGTASLDGHLKEINPAWQRLLGWDDASLLSVPFAELVDPADHDEVARMIESLSRGEPAANFTARLLTLDGGLRTATWTVAVDDDMCYIVGRDMTAQRDIEERLRQSQKMEAIGQLTGGIAHDFNNLLTGITGSLDLIRLRLRAGRTDGLDRFMTAASTSAQRAAALTHRLLAFSLRQSLDTRPADVNQLVAGMEDLIRRTIGERVEFRTVLRAELWAALADANQLENAILNLAINARDAMPDGGALTIETSNCSLSDSAALAQQDAVAGDYVRISVTDTGIGMSADVIARAFEPFFTTKPIGHGTGLGLSMIYGFAKQSGGHVRIDSKPGDGTTFLLYLPRAVADGAFGSAVKTTDTPRGQGETVLVVEDEPSVRLLIVEVLQELGYAYLEAADGRSAVPMLQSGQRIDLLVTDVGLPNMNGRELAEVAREARPDIKILFVTGYAADPTMRGGFLTTGMDMLTKPFALDALATKIRDMLGR
ncbi:hypothetical protein BH10PSE17_BH10PSE17_02110 [soil metagenome]